MEKTVRSEKLDFFNSLVTPLEAVYYKNVKASLHFQLTVGSQTYNEDILSVELHKMGLMTTFEILKCGGKFCITYIAQTKSTE